MPNQFDTPNTERQSARQRVTAALNFTGPDRLPRDVWGGRAIAQFRPHEWQDLLARYPMDIERAPSVLASSTRADGDAGAPGSRIDDWGSEWTALGLGVAGEVTRPVLRDWAEMATFTPPWEMLDDDRIEAINALCRASDAFMLGEVGPGPFERLQFLRGSEPLFYDLADEPRALMQLLELVHDFYQQHVALWCRTDVDAVVIGDDWGSQTALLISPGQWRRLFRPLYAAYFTRMRAAGKRVFFHSDGYIREIIPDLVDIGVEALNSQLFCMDIEEIARSFRGRLTFWGEVDRQHVLPFGTVDKVRHAVHRLRGAFGGDSGGLMAQLSWGINDPWDNIQAAFEALT